MTHQLAQPRRVLIVTFSVDMLRLQVCAVSSAGRNCWKTAHDDQGLQLAQNGAHIGPLRLSTTVTHHICACLLLLYRLLPGRMRMVTGMRLVCTFSLVPTLT